IDRSIHARAPKMHDSVLLPMPDRANRHQSGPGVIEVPPYDWESRYSPNDHGTERVAKIGIWTRRCRGRPGACNALLGDHVGQDDSAARRRPPSPKSCVVRVFLTAALRYPLPIALDEILDVMLKLQMLQNGIVEHVFAGRGLERARRQGQGFEQGV